MTRPNSHGRLQAEVRAAADVLRREWDPIGGGETPDLPTDEYDSYAPHVVSMIAKGKPDADIAIYLNHLETEIIEVASGRDLVVVARLLRAAVAAARARAT
jgi:hypothetical protein